MDVMVIEYKDYRQYAYVDADIIKCKSVSECKSLLNIIGVLKYYAKSNDNNNLKPNNTNISKQKSWKQTAGPPRKPVPAAPKISIKQTKTSVTSDSPLKPLRGFKKMEEYENNDIEPKKNVRNKPPQNIRSGTLDGQVILGGGSDDGKF